MEERLKQLVQDCLGAYELISFQILSPVDHEFGDEEIFKLTSSLHDRFRALAPDWPGVLPLETPHLKETQMETYQRLLDAAVVDEDD